MKCPNCGEQGKLRGFRKTLKGTTQRFYCRHCDKMFSSTTSQLQFPVEITNQNINYMTEEELRSKYDNKFILRNAVAKLEKSIFIPENEFISNCKIKVSSGYRMAVDSEEFQGFRGVAPGGVVYWSHPESISKMKNEGILK